MRVLCMDIATRTGWCALIDGRRHSGVVDLSLDCSEKAGEFVRHPHILGALATLIRELVSDFEPTFLVIEGGFSRGAGSQLLHRLIGVAMAEAQHAGLGVIAVPGSSWKKAILGRGNPQDPKAASIAHAQTLAPHVTDDNEADAICISDYADRVLVKEKAA